MIQQLFWQLQFHHMLFFENHDPTLFAIYKSFSIENLQDHFDTEQNKKDVFRIKDGHLFGG